MCPNENGPATRLAAIGSTQFPSSSEVIHCLQLGKLITAESTGPYDEVVEVFKGCQAQRKQSFLGQKSRLMKDPSSDN